MYQNATAGTRSSWDTTFTQWAQPPGKAEEERCENAVRAIRNAIARSEKLNRRDIKVFTHGSYRNNVNVRKESDVDIGVMCHQYFLSQYPPGKTRADFGHVDAPYSFKEFKDELEEALVAYFGRAAVQRGNKAIDVHETTYHVEADVAPFFEYRHYGESGSYLCGVALISDQGTRIINYPERLLKTWPAINQHYENGVAKNSATGRRFKGMVRILKSARNAMEDAGIQAVKAIPGFLIECLVWNVPDFCFSNDSWHKDVRAALSYLWLKTRKDENCADWMEVSELKYLFRSMPTKRQAAHAFIDAAWNYVGEGGG